MSGAEKHPAFGSVLDPCCMHVRWVVFAAMASASGKHSRPVSDLEWCWLVAKEQSQLSRKAMEGAELEKAHLWRVLVGLLFLRGWNEQSSVY